MKQDYLWDKTGSDPEIEDFENALAVFRYKETAPPAIQPAQVVPFKKTTRRLSFRFAYAIAACAAFAMIGWGAWYQISGYEIEFQENLVKTVQPPEIIETPQPVLVVDKTDDSLAAKPEIPRQIPERKFIKISKNFSPETASAKIPKIKNSAAKSAEPQLTKEEKYAYNQLMLALSITGSKLKMVKDKVEGIEETPIVEKGR